MNQEKKAGFEKREFARIAITLQIKFRSFVQFERGLEASITNLSLGGMFISTTHVRPLGTTVEIEIPDHEGNICKISGTVRSRPYGGGIPLGMGISFDNMDKNAKEFIEYIIAKYSKS